MIRTIFLTSLFFVFVHQSCFSQDSRETIEKAREKHEAFISDPKNYRMDSTELAHFEGLDYFEFDSTYQIEATFTKDIGKRFKMPTTTDRMPGYRRYGYVSFQCDSVSYTLTAYQNIQMRKEEGFEDYLFIPFRDATSRVTTYGGGRYLDLRIPEEETILLDFNLTYNPYCAYSHRFSCPIPPEENTLKVAIEAGEKIPLAH